MKIGSARLDGKSIGVCAVSESEVVRLSDLLSGVDSVKQLIERGPSAVAELARVVESARTNPAVSRISVAGLDWLAPVPDPQKIFCLALNNSSLDHVGVYMPTVPVYFEKPVSSLVGHKGAIELYPHYGLTHSEPELAVIIGKTARNVAAADAMNYVFGYSIINDVTSGGMRVEDRFHVRIPGFKDGDTVATYTEEHLTYPARYKGCDTFAPMGPWLVTVDEVADPHALSIKGWLDDSLTMDDNTANMRFSVAQAIEWMSAHSTLLPGDVIAMGTALHPDRERKPITAADMNRIGGVSRIEIGDIGTLENPIHRRETKDPRSKF